jgi:drug/metabolite transporter (DMT)-like permease
MSVLLATLSAGLFGTGDFLGGLATRRDGRAITVVVGVNLIGVAVVGVLLTLLGGTLELDDIGWAAGAGISGSIGLALFYRGLAIGTMSVVATLSALLTAVVPLGWGLVTGERPEPVAWMGVMLALLAIGLVTRHAAGGRRLAGGVLEGLASGAGFGTFFILIANTRSSELFVLLFSRLASTAVFVAVALAVGLSLVPHAGVRWAVVGSGFFDVTANLLFLLAERRGLLSLVAVIVSLYPAMTILLARVFLHERLLGSQWLGVAAAAAGVALISIA